MATLYKNALPLYSKQSISLIIKEKELIHAHH
ncbi:MAG: hypothetical protein JWP13_56 [Candidatus Saccharibacteria bacterium]|nr:hypothetical protein [Candidatus Saccharibacteria bacterium]